MTKFSDNDSPSLLFTEQGSTPTTPAATHQRLFIRTSDHVLCYVNSSGTVTAVGVSSTAPATAATAYNSTAQTITTSTFTAMTFDTETAPAGDTGTIHSTSSATSKFTVPTTGWYQCWANVNFDAVAAAATIRILTIYVNGAEIAFGRTRQPSQNNSDIENIQLSKAIKLTATDFVEFIFWHNKGSNLNIGGTTAGQMNSAGVFLIGT